MDTRTKVAAGLLLAILSLLQTANAAQAATGTEVLHACDRSQRLFPGQSAFGVENQAPKGGIILDRVSSWCGQESPQ